MLRAAALACRQIPNGIHGIEERLHIAWHTLVNTGLIGAPDFVRLTSAAAAKIFNIYPRKGAVLPGSDADLIIFDPAKKHTLGAGVHFSALDTSIYEGMRIQGKVGVTHVHSPLAAFASSQLCIAAMQACSRALHDMQLPCLQKPFCIAIDASTRGLLPTVSALFSRGQPCHRVPVLCELGRCRLRLT